MRLRLTLNEETWKNIVETIRQSDIKPVSNFWAGIQSIEEQLKEWDDMFK